MMQLQDYPEAIASQRLNLLSLAQTKRALAESIASSKAKVKKTICDDKTLTNETKRKAREAELLESTAHQSLLNELHIIEDRIVLGQINLEKLNNLFEVEKIVSKMQLNAL